MNTFFTQLKNLARSVKLSQGEKQNMRVNLYTYFENNPIGNFAVPSPKIFQPVPSTFYFFSPRYMAPIALVLVIGLGSGTAFAAQASLPGDALYTVKINVDEPVQVALATSPAAKAQVNASIATTRLEEAETLASTGKLDATTTAALASNFTAHAQAAQAGAASLQSNDPGTAAQLGTDFNSTLAAHGAILAQIGDDSSSTETMQNSNSLAIAVQHEADHDNDDDITDSGQVTLAIATATSTDVTAPATAAPAVAPAMQNGARVRTFAAAMPQTEATGTATSSGTTSVSVKSKGKQSGKGDGDSKVSASLGAQASTSIAAMLQDFAALTPSLDATTTAQLSAQIDAVQTEYAQGNFGAAIRMAIKLDIYFKAGKNINVKLLSGLLDSNS